MIKDKYLKKIYDSKNLEASPPQISQAIEDSGHFNEYAEWRMGTCAEIEITKLDQQVGWPSNA